MRASVERSRGPSASGRSFEAVQPEHRARARLPAPRPCVSKGPRGQGDGAAGQPFGRSQTTLTFSSSVLAADFLASDLDSVQ